MNEINILSLGLGVQSSALYYLSSMGIIPKADCAVFVDPGAESLLTYNYLEYINEWSKKNNGIKIHVVKEKNIYDDIMSKEQNRFASIPSYVVSKKNGVGMLKRQCTNEYKIKPFDIYIKRNILNLKKYKKVKNIVNVWKGISIDEIDRMKHPREKWKRHIYPLSGWIVEHSKAYRMENENKLKKIMSRNQCIDFMQKHNINIPPKSSCVFCPYKSDKSWMDMKKNNPDDWNKALNVDNKIRNNNRLNGNVFLHESCVPLNNIDFNSINNDDDLFSSNCSDNCHI